MTDVLLHVGPPKTGSTFLQAWFAAHPQLAFFSGQEHGRGHISALTDFAYRSSGGRPRAYVVSDENLSVAWPARPELVGLSGRLELYEKRLADAQAQVCGMLHDLFPAARVLITTRGYHSYVLSAYSEYVNQGGPLALREGLATFGEQGRQWLDYDYLVEVYQRAFGPENVLVLPFGLLRDDAARFLAIIESWLGLDHFEYRLEARKPCAHATGVVLVPEALRPCRTGGLEAPAVLWLAFVRSVRVELSPNRKTSTSGLAARPVWKSSCHRPAIARQNTSAPLSAKGACSPTTRCTRRTHADYLWT